MISSTSRSRWADRLDLPSSLFRKVFFDMGRMEGTVSCSRTSATRECFVHGSVDRSKLTFLSSFAFSRGDGGTFFSLAALIFNLPLTLLLLFPTQESTLSFFRTVSRFLIASRRRPNADLSLSSFFLLQEPSKSST